jgi:hypothetical protein
MSHHSSNPSERPIISGTTTLTEPLEPYLPGNQPAGSLSGQTDTAPSHQQLGTGTGHLMAVPGGYISTSPTPLSKMGRKSADETTYPSIMTGGTGPEVMLGKWHLAESVNFDNYLKALGEKFLKEVVSLDPLYCVSTFSQMNSRPKLRFNANCSSCNLCRCRSFTSLKTSILLKQNESFDDKLVIF